MRRLLRGILLFAIAFLANGCGGGGGSSSPAPTPSGSIDGFWDGTFTSTVLKQTFGVYGIVKSGRMVVFSDEGAIYDGSISTNGNSFTATITGYAINGGAFGVATVTGTFTEHGTISGTYTSTNGDAGTVALTFDPLYDRDSSLSLTQGVWSQTDGLYTMTLTVLANGSFTGSDTDACTYNGAVSIIDPNYDLYNMTVNVASCGVFDGAYSGWAALTDEPALNDTLSFYVRSANSIVFGDLKRQ